MNPLMIATRSVLSKYATFTGRASKSEFWWWVLAVFILLFVTRLIDGMIVTPLLGFDSFQAEGGQPLSAIVSLGLIIPQIAVAVRRLHDTGRVGWWVLISLIPIIGILVLIYFYIQPSDKGSNEYGPQEPFGSN